MKSISMRAMESSSNSPVRKESSVQSLVKRGIYQVYTEYSDGLLLQLRRLIAKVDVQEHLAGWGAGFGLKANTQPPVLLVGALIIAGGNRVGKDKEACILAASRIEPVQQEACTHSRAWLGAALSRHSAYRRHRCRR